MNQMFALALAGLIALMVTGCGSAGSTGGCTTNCGGGGGTPTVTVPTGPSTLQICGGPSYTYKSSASSGGVTLSVSDTSLATISSAGVVTPTCTAASAGQTVDIIATSTSDATVSEKLSVALKNQVMYDLKASDFTSSAPEADTWVANSDGSDAADVLSDGCLQPNYFTGHTAFVCIANDATGNNVQIFSADGTAEATLTTTLPFPTLSLLQAPTPSPDGKNILFIGADTSTNAWATYTASAVDGSDLKALSQEVACTGGCPGISNASWSHDGKLIVYNHIVHYQILLWVMNADGSNQTQLTSSEAADGVFSLDDKTIYFDERSGIYSIPVAGGTPTLWKSGAYDPVVSPDGTKIAYLSGSAIYTANTADGSDVQQILSTPSLITW